MCCRHFSSTSLSGYLCASFLPPSAAAQLRRSSNEVLELLLPIHSPLHQRAHQRVLSEYRAHVPENCMCVVCLHAIAVPVTDLQALFRSISSSTCSSTLVNSCRCKNVFAMCLCAIAGSVIDASSRRQSCLVPSENNQKTNWSTVFLDLTPQRDWPKAKVMFVFQNNQVKCGKPKSRRLQLCHGRSVTISCRSR